MSIFENMGMRAAIECARQSELDAIDQRISAMKAEEKSLENDGNRDGQEARLEKVRAEIAKAEAQREVAEATFASNLASIDSLDRLQQDQLNQAMRENDRSREGALREQFEARELLAREKLEEDLLKSMDKQEADRRKESVDREQYQLDQLRQDPGEVRFQQEMARDAQERERERKAQEERDRQREDER